MNFVLFTISFILILVGQALAVDTIIPSLKSKQSYSNSIHEQDDRKTFYNNSDKRNPEIDTPRVSVAYYDQETGEFIEIRRTGPDSYSGYNQDKGIYLDFEINPEGGIVIYDSKPDNRRNLDMD